MKTAVFECYSGIAGDMIIGAFLDAGFDFKILKAELKKLGLKGYKLSREQVKQGYLSGTQFKVSVKDKAGHRHTSFGEIKKLIRRSRLKKGVKEKSLRIFTALAGAESKVHGLKADKVHFHEVGAVDSIIDIVGAAVCLEKLGVEKIFVKELTVGRGSLLKGTHMFLPVPAPATIRLLKGFKITYSDLGHELVTPTGASFLAALSEKTDNLPAIEVESVGYGVGETEIKERPNLLRVTLGELAGRFREERIIVLETNIDDLPPLAFEPLYEKLFERGALDVYLTPILMKKGRLAFKLSVLLENSIREEMAETVFNETPTLGVRFTELDRFILQRKKIRVKTRHGRVSVKTGTLGSENVVYSPEYDDCKRLAEKKKVPFRKIYDEAKKEAAK